MAVIKQQKSLFGNECLSFKYDIALISVLYFIQQTEIALVPTLTLQIQIILQFPTFNK